ncbi:MAG: hypothetical protein IPM55_04900 [Acidobacteria bacterium]|nr:hypothetical protein [Acidobacteriota bacterium]
MDLIHSRRAGIERGGSGTRDASQAMTNWARCHGASYLRSACRNRAAAMLRHKTGCSADVRQTVPYRMSPCLAVRKFSPLTQIISMPP